VKNWYVIAKDTYEDEDKPPYTNVFGPFMSETDARAYAMDLQHENGWSYIEAEQLTPETAAELATEEVLWPYTSEENNEEE